MADKIPSLGNFTIPDSVIDAHEWVSDAFIDSLGKTCILVYPPKITECPNCYYDPRSGRSSGVYRSGGPVSFANNTTCPWCGGEGRSSDNVTEDIKLRIYWTPKEWQNIGVPIDAADEMAQIIGYMSDLPKVEKATEIILNKDVQGIKQYRCQREGEAVPWGFRQTRYFVQFVKRIGGG